jgi:hypothetical protein
MKSGGLQQKRTQMQKDDGMTRRNAQRRERDVKEMHSKTLQDKVRRERLISDVTREVDCKQM